MTTRTDELGNGDDRGYLKMVKYPCVATGGEVLWETAGQPDACMCGNCRQWLCPPENSGARPATVTVPEGDDPIPALRTMAAFMPGEDRGVAQIIVNVPRPEGPPGPKFLGYVALRGHPEKTPLPIFDAATREMCVCDLAMWLRARGYEASACRWEQLSPGSPLLMVKSPEVRWRLVTGEPAVPALPPEAQQGTGVHFSFGSGTVLNADQRSAIRQNIADYFGIETKGR